MKVAAGGLIGSEDVVPGYQDLVELARSDRAVVYRAWQPAFQRHVAVKLLPHGSLEGLASDSRRAVALAGHPNVVTVHEFGLTSGGIPFVAMELLEHGSIAERIRRDGALDWYDATQIAVSLAGVLASAPDLMVSPEHVLLSRFGEPKLVVIGARPAEGPSSLRSTLAAMLTGELGSPTAEPDLGGVPAALRRAVLDTGPEPPPAELAAQLQAVQADAGRPVTALPMSRATRSRPEAPFAPAPVLSGAITAAPSVGRKKRSVRIPVVAGLAVLGIVVAALATVSDEQVGTTNTSVAGARPRPVDPALYTADFTPGGGWDYEQAPGTGATYVDGQYRLHVDQGRGFARSPFTTSAAESKLSVTISAELASSPTGSISLICGEEGPGFKHLTGTLFKDGAWEVIANGGVISKGSAPSAAAALQEPFTLRLDCTTDRTPTVALLYVNDVLVADSGGLEAFPVRAAGFKVLTKEAPLDLTLKAMEVRRLG